MHRRLVSAAAVYVNGSGSSALYLTGIPCRVPGRDRGDTSCLSWLGFSRVLSIRRQEELSCNAAEEGGEYPQRATFSSNALLLRFLVFNVKNRSRQVGSTQRSSRNLLRTAQQNEAERGTPPTPRLISPQRDQLISTHPGRYPQCCCCCCCCGCMLYISPPEGKPHALAVVHLLHCCSKGCAGRQNIFTPARIPLGTRNSTSLSHPKAKLSLLVFLPWTPRG